jgi:hypothetical protein
MKKAAGLWIDYKKTVIVVVTHKGEATKLIMSKAEKQLPRIGDSPLKGSSESLQIPASNSHQKTFQRLIKLIKME